VTVLVTGNLGYIGKNLCQRLEREKIEYVPFDLRNGEDVRNRGQLKKKAKGVDLVYHLAAQVGVPQCEEYPLEAYETNVRGTFNVLNLDAKVVFASSFASMNPDSVYGLTKLVGEKLVLDAGGTVLRLSNVYGGPNFFEEKDTVISRFIRAKKEGRKAEIYGDGRQTRDFIHVQDVVDSLIKAQNYNGLHNVCTGERTSVLELAEMIGVDYKHEEARENDPKHPGSGVEPSELVNPKRNLEDWIDARVG